MNYRRDIYKKTYKLLEKQNWLNQKQDEFFDLLSLCQNTQQEELLWDLLYRFKYLESKDLTTNLETLIDHIINVWKLNPMQTQIVAATFDNEPDSAQFILQFLKPKLPNYAWQEAKLINNINNSVRYIKDFPNVVIIDEFIGTGRTIAKRIKVFKKMYRDNLVSKNLPVRFNIKVCSIACMKFAKNIIDDTGSDIFSALWLDKGITDYYRGEDRRIALQNMWNLEDQLDQDSGKEFFESLGWGGAESLYSFQDANAPNSVFPIFWWKYLSNGKFRKTIIDRYH